MYSSPQFIHRTSPYRYPSENYSYSGNFSNLSRISSQNSITPELRPNASSSGVFSNTFDASDTSTNTHAHADNEIDVDRNVTHSYVNVSTLTDFDGNNNDASEGGKWVKNEPIYYDVRDGTEVKARRDLRHFVIREEVFGEV